MATITQPSNAHSIQFHGLGLLTTVASLPPKYRSRYLSVKTKCEIPLDLSVKLPSPTNTATPMPLEIVTETETETPAIQTTQIICDVPMASTFTEVYTEPISEIETAESHMEVQHEVIVITEKPQTPEPTATTPTPPPPTPTPPPPPPYQSPNAKRTYTELISAEPLPPPPPPAYEHPAKLQKTSTHPTIKRDATPTKPIKTGDSVPRKAPTPSTKPTRSKATRKLKFDEETSSPVSGTIIRPLEEINGDGAIQYSNGDIDPKYNIVEITEETKAELAAIKNVIGDYICRLCRIRFDDAFGLAQHRCACIVLLEYRCPECGKQFNCPANLASHRRWHKPKKHGNGNNETTGTGAGAKKENRNNTNQQTAIARTVVVAAAATKKHEEFAFACNECGKQFKRQAYLRKHQQTHNATSNVNGNNSKRSGKGKENAPQVVATATANVATTIVPTTATTTTIVGTFQTTPYINAINYAASSSAASSSASTHEDEGVYVASYDYDANSLSDCSEASSSSTGYGRLQIVENGLTEEESIAAAALTNLRNCASVIQHTTLAH